MDHSRSLMAITESTNSIRELRVAVTEAIHKDVVKTLQSSAMPVRTMLLMPPFHLSRQIVGIVRDPALAVKFGLVEALSYHAEKLPRPPELPEMFPDVPQLIGNRGQRARAQHVIEASELPESLGTLDELAMELVLGLGRAQYVVPHEGRTLRSMHLQQVPVLSQSRHESHTRQKDTPRLVTTPEADRIPVGYMRWLPPMGIDHRHEVDDGLSDLLKFQWTRNHSHEEVRPTAVARVPRRPHLQDTPSVELLTLHVSSFQSKGRMLIRLLKAAHEGWKSRIPRSSFFEDIGIRSAGDSCYSIWIGFPVAILWDHPTCDPVIISQRSR